MSKNKFLHLTTRIAWALFFLFLPVTSFPYFPSGFGGGTLVRPLSIYPLMVLLVLATLPRLFSKPVPRAFQALVIFVLICCASAVLSLIRGVEPVMGITVIDRGIRALITLGIGIAMYLTVVLVHKTADDLRFSLRWMYAGFIAAFVWGSLQVLYIIKFNPAYFNLLSRIQGVFSSRKLFNSRISGMTYEPNWFAQQICFLLLPWLLASVITNSSVFSIRWKKITVEWILLLWAVGLIVYTFSRAGLATMIGVAFVALAFFRSRSSTKKAAANRRALIYRLVEAGGVVVLLVGAIFFAGSKNPFFARLWSYWRENSQTSLSRYIEYIGFGARMAYGVASYNVYNAYPWFGVGPGNFAFYFEELIPDQPLARTPELLRIIAPEEGRNRLITPKNFYLRLLAETGIVGTAAFAAFLVAIIGCAIYLWLSPEPNQQFWGQAGMLGIIVFAIAAFTFDSFAIPNMWVVFGLVTAAASVTDPSLDGA